jgi:hypothetical protein
MKTPDPKHLKWLVESRRQNQEVSALLYELIMAKKCWKNRKLGYEAKTLVSIGFALWRESTAGLLRHVPACRCGSCPKCSQRLSESAGFWEDESES